MKITNKPFTLLTLLTLILAVAPLQPARALFPPDEGFNPKAGGNPVVAASVQIDINGPTGSGAFGTTVTALPNGNFVVTDPNYSIPSGAANVGAVYLYDGATLTVISVLTGSKANDNVGNPGVTVLTNGNYVVRSSGWGNPTGLIVGVGAVTWCSAATGCNGVVSASNSLIGGTAGDNVGNPGVTVLTNGNYVVRSSDWDNLTGLIVDVGAVTWGDGTVGTVGLVTSSNSLIGSTANDRVGGDGVTVLTNGNYVVSNPFWDNPTGPIADVGAATWGDGNGGTVGLVSSGNSLVGGTAGDFVGGAMALTNGNYVVGSSVWDNPTGPIADVGAATWGDGNGGTVGLVTPSNSLIGGTAGDNVGSSGVTLTNGNYVVGSSYWDNPTGPIADVGAVTWGNGSSGTVGLVTSGNSLIGGTASDFIGYYGVTALTNGNYVVQSNDWDNPAGPVADVGAATWGDGNGGTVGLVTPGNSLIGGTAFDNVGGFDVTALTNGNYVVSSPFWDNPTGPIADVGAATWGDGNGGTVGLVTSSNSLIGGTAGDNVGWGGVVPTLTALTNGNYVVQSNYWDNPMGPITDVGAVTWGDGTGGTVGLVTSGNSLIGGTASDLIGNYSVTALTNGNYVVASPNWDNSTGPITDVGAVTWGNGTVGTVGLVTPSNSLIGGTTGDSLGSDGVTTLTNGNYVLQNDYWDNPIGPVVDARAVTLGNGSVGAVGLITSANSVLGTVTNGISDFPGFSFDPVYNRLIVGRSGSNIVTLFGCPLCTTNLFLPLIMR